MSHPLTSSTPRLLTALLICALGCGPQAEEGPSSEPVAVEPADAGRAEPPPMTCSLSLTGSATVGEGSLLELEAEVEENSQQVSLGLPEGWSLWSTPTPTSWIVRAPYDAAEGVFSASVECEGRRVETEHTVTLTNIRWDKLEFEGEVPATREHPQVWISSADPDSLYLYGGFLYQPQQFTPASDLWRLDLPNAAWERVPQRGELPEFGAGRLAPHPSGDGIFLFGGDAPRTGESSPGIFSLSLMDGAVWREEAETAFTRSLGLFVHDRPHERYLSVCGIGPAPSYAMDCAPRSWNPATQQWAVFEQSTGPSDRYGFFSGHDPDRQRLVIFSGAGFPTRNDSINPQQDAWILDISTDTPQWHALETEGEVPAGRRNGCGAWDQHGQRLLVWGGTSDGLTATPGLNALHISEDGQAGTWEAIEPAGGPRPRSSCFGVLDAARHRVLVGYGNDDARLYQDLWALQL